MTESVLEIQDLTVAFPTRHGVVRAVSAVSLSVVPGGRIGLVGESGSGKSMTLLTAMRLTPHPGQITGGQIHYHNRNLFELDNKAMRSLRGKEIAMIFQDPMTTLNPVHKIGDQIRETLKVHNIYGGQSFRREKSRRKEEQLRVYRLMEEVGIPSPEERYENYPHEFSGGMQQRAVIAIALSCNPKVLLADEPTTSLDVTVQAQIMALLEKISRERQTAIILVTHDLSLAAEFCERIAVMYAGSIVEEGSVSQVIDTPLHPYTRGLLNALPRLGLEKKMLEPIPGEIDMADLPPGCIFAPRCREVVQVCWESKPGLVAVENGHLARCHLCRNGS